MRMWNKKQMGCRGWCNTTWDCQTKDGSSYIYSWCRLWVFSLGSIISKRAIDANAKPTRLLGVSPRSHPPLTHALGTHAHADVATCTQQSSAIRYILDDTLSSWNKSAYIKLPCDVCSICLSLTCTQLLVVHPMLLCNGFCHNLNNIKTNLAKTKYAADIFLSPTFGKANNTILMNPSGYLQRGICKQQTPFTCVGILSREV